MQLTKKAAKWKVPTDFDGGRFELMKMFALGTNNIIKRSGDFGDLFLKVSSKKCETPDHVFVEGVNYGDVITLKDFLSQGVDMYSYRTPIKLAGFLLEQQKHGNPGALLVNGAPNYFFCRSRFKNDLGEWEESLTMVQFEYQNGWKITTSEFKGSDHVFEGQCQVFLSVRF
jgi:hypothetical protein